MIAPARQAAFDALIAHEVRGADLPGALAAARGRVTDPRDHALVTELVSGTVRMRRALDYQLAPRTTRAFAALDAEVRVSLRMSAFQILYLDRLPVSAVVHDAVDLTRRAGKTSAAGLVNAVLRSLSRDRPTLSWPTEPRSHALSVRHSHPEWLVARWLERYGEADTERWLAFNNRPPRLCLAVNRLRGTREQLAGDLAREGVETEPTARSAHGLHVVTGAALSTDAFRQGRFIVQDEASQLIAQLGDVHAGQRVLDLCASPGGKTLALAARMGSTGALVACDVRPRRVRLLQQTVDRLGIPASVVRISADEAAPFADGAFDYVLVDAPCSGLGTLRRDPDIRWARTVDDLARLAGAQRRLLARAARLVAPGGTLVYATCSSEPDENQDVVAAHLAEDGRLRLEDVHVTTPVGDGLEAFYGAVLRRDV